MKNCLILLSIIVPVICYSLESHNEMITKPTSYIIRLEFPASVKKIPAVSGYYKGYKLEFDNDMCIIPESRCYNNFAIVVTNQVNHKSDRNNIQYLERMENKPCRLFYITREYDINNPEATTSWSIEEEKEHNLPLRLPESAFVLLLNPKYIDTISYDKQMKLKLNKVKDSVIILPTIVISPTITEEELNKSSIYTLLASLDANAIHTQPKKAVKQERTVLISMNTLAR